MIFVNFYCCTECSREWVDLSTAQCDDDCPHCGARHVSPYASEEAVEEDEDE